MSIEFTSLWKQSSHFYHKEVLTGKFCHWCKFCDMIPIDETVDLWKQCECFTDKEKEQGFPDPIPVPEANKNFNKE